MEHSDKLGTVTERNPPDILVRDTITDATGELPRFEHLPKDVLEMLQQGKVDEALQVLAKLQASEEKVVNSAILSQIVKILSSPISFLEIFFSKLFSKDGKEQKITTAKINNAPEYHQSSLKHFMNTFLIKKLMQVLHKLGQLPFRGIHLTMSAVKKIFNGIHFTAQVLMTFGRVNIQLAEYLAKRSIDHFQSLKNKVYQVADFTKKMTKPILEYVQKQVKKCTNYITEIAEKVREKVESTIDFAKAVIFGTITVLEKPTFALFHFFQQRVIRTSLKFKHMGKWGFNKLGYSFQRSKKIVKALSQSFVVTFKSFSLGIKRLFYLIFNVLVNLLKRLLNFILKVYRVFSIITGFTFMLISRVFKQILPRFVKKRIKSFSN